MERTINTLLSQGFNKIFKHNKKLLQNEKTWSFKVHLCTTKG